MSLPKETYHRVMLALFDLSENARKYITLSEIRNALPEFKKLDKKEKGKYKGTKQLAAALAWLENKGLIQVERTGKRNKYKPSMQKHQYLGRLMEELEIKRYFVA